MKILVRCTALSLLVGLVMCLGQKVPQASAGGVAVQTDSNYLEVSDAAGIVVEINDQEVFPVIQQQSSQQSIETTVPSSDKDGLVCESGQVIVSDHHTHTETSGTYVTQQQQITQTCW